MSLALIRSALETALANITPPISYAYENVPFTPIVGTPYAAVYLLPAKPDNIEMGPGYTDRGIFQVNLFWPLDTGPAAATSRAALIRAKFPFASTFNAGGVTVLITGTPEVAPARVEDDLFMIPVKIPFTARIS